MIASRKTKSGAGQRQAWVWALTLGLGLGAPQALWAQAPGLGQGPELGANVDGLLALARAQSPELTAARYEVDAAARRVQPAGALPDPMLRVELENFNNYGRDARPNLLPARVGDTKYTLLQAFPAWGKRDLRRDVAAAELQQAGARASAAWTDLAARIKTAYAQYYLTAGTERITLEVVDLMSRLEQLAQARYAGGLVAQQDAIRAQLERTALRSELIVLDNQKQQQRVRLNALLARAGDAPLAEPQQLRPLPAVGAQDAPALAERARAVNPRLQAEEARLRGAERNRELTRRNRYPDFAVGLSPMQQGSRLTAWSLMVELNLPLQQDTRRSQEQEAEAMVDAARAQSQALAQQLLGELGENLAAIDAARRTESLIGAQLLPQSELSLRSALAAYENGKVDFATLLDAERQIRRARQDRLKVQVEAQMRLAEIERIVGEEL
jgi:outer membrane protein TolC